MRYLAVPEMPHRSLWASLRHFGHRTAEWHAVSEASPSPIRTLCGIAYGSEALRTWDQTTAADRCPQCERLVTGADKAKGATFIAEVPPQTTEHESQPNRATQSPTQTGPWSGRNRRQPA